MRLSSRYTLVGFIALAAAAVIALVLGVQALRPAPSQA